VARGNVSGSVSLAKDLEDKDWVGDAVQPGVDGKIMAELDPELPSAVIGVGARRNDSGSGRFLCSAKVKEESIPLLGCRKRQDLL
jgi:hypothetical protein